MIRISSLMISERALTSMLQQQSRVSDTQLQLSSGKRIMTAADDPAGAARVLGLNASVETVQQYQGNIDRLKARLETEEGALIGVGNMLQRAYELAIQGNNDSLTQGDTRPIADEVRHLMAQIFAQANSRDSSGEYIFSGFQTGTLPFNENMGTFTYSGDLGQRLLQISPDRQVADGDNGYDVFMDVTTGPIATVTTAAATAFTAITDGDLTIDGGNGMGPISLGDIPAAADAAERANQLLNAINAVSAQTDVNATLATATTLTLTGVGGTGVTLALAGTATTASTGMTAGTTASATGKRSIFETMELLASQLDTGSSVDQYITDVQLALDNILQVRTSIGARMNAVDLQSEVNKDLKLSLETHLSEERDLDYTEAITRFQRQMTALEAAQKAYAQVQRLSLFNYL